MNRMLATVRIPTAVYTPLPAPNLGKPIKRKMDDLEEDDIYEGIKRLYNEEDAINMGTCAREAMRDTVTSCALTAVANWLMLNTQPATLAPATDSSGIFRDSWFAANFVVCLCGN